MPIPQLILVLFALFSLIGCPAAPEEDPVSIEGDEAGECSDEADNDSDGLFDCDDEGCKGSPACKEEPATEGTTGAGAGAGARKAFLTREKKEGDSSSTAFRLCS